MSEIPDAFATRSGVQSYVDDIDGDELDLSGVEFVSRAAADEILYQAEQQNLTIKAAEADGMVQKMLRIVEETAAADD